MRVRPAITRATLIALVIVAAGLLATGCGIRPDDQPQVISQSSLPRALFDTETGEVVGVVNMAALKGTRESALTRPSGISYAIPVDHVLRLLATLAHK